MWTRRAFLKSGGLAVFAAGMGGCPLFLNRAAQAATLNGRRKVLVTIFQRGAMDGLMAVPTFRDPNLAVFRPRLAMPATGEGAVIDLDGTFGLHPALAAFLPYYREGRLAVVHGVGSPNPTRSHFDAQDYMETGTPWQKSTASGWLNRAVGLTGHEATPFQAVALARALPRSLYGPHPALAVANLKDFALRIPASKNLSETTGKTLEALYEQTTQDLLHDTGHDGFEATRLLEQVGRAPYQPAHGARYPGSPLGRSLQEIAHLIKAGVGLEVAFTESAGWDTHVLQGAANGTFARNARDLAEAVAAFWTDLGDLQDEVTLMTMTEFGRTVHENGAGGTDHGRASCLFILGNRVKGGRVYGRVPPLDRDALEDGRDLPVTTDFRAVFAEVAGKHLGLTRDDVLFPGWDGGRLPLMQR